MKVEGASEVMAMGEKPIFTTKAHVFQIDPATKKKWLPASSQAVGVSYYYDSTRGTYRIISVESGKAIVNSTLSSNMTFTKTSQKFGQWSDARAGTVYGLGFGSEADCAKFVEKFKEVKEELRSSETSTPVNNNSRVTPVPRAATPVKRNSASSIRSSGEGSEREDTESHKPQPPPVQMRSTTPSYTTQTSAPAAMRRNSRESPSPSVSAPIINSSLIDQLKYENDRLKIALAQSSANAKKWEVELQTLKNNNARLTTALQESTANVEEWKKQLSQYKDESTRLKKRLIDSEAGGGSELLQKQLSDLRDQITDLETSNRSKDAQISALQVSVDASQELSHTVDQLEKDLAEARVREDRVSREAAAARSSKASDARCAAEAQRSVDEAISKLTEVKKQLQGVGQG